MKASLALLDSRKAVIEQVIPSTMRDMITWESIRTSVATALAANPRLAQADPQSVYASVLYILRMGLEIGGPAQQAYLVPFKGACTPMIGAQGKIELAMRSGRIEAMTTQIVYERDTFTFDFLRPDSNSHVPAFGDRGRAVLCYAAIWLKGARVPLIEIMSEADFRRIEADALKRSGGKPSPAWKAWPTEMWRRSCLNRALKRAPKSRDLWEVLTSQTAIDLGGRVSADKAGRVEVIDAPAEAFGALPDYGEDDADEAPVQEREAVPVEREQAPAKRQARRSEPDPDAYQGGADDDGGMP